MNAQECGFEPPQNYQTFDNLIDNRNINSTEAIENYCVNVCFRIVRDNDGSNAAIDPSIIPQILAQLNSKFSPHGITFNQVGTFDYVNNTTYNNYTAGNSPSLIPNCLNLFFIKIFQNNPSFGGIASFGTLRAVIRGSSALGGSTTHEVGHALNLLHTFTCSNPYNASCAESPFNSNECDLRGDKICDTPADYNPLTPLSTVQYPNPFTAINYNPDYTNIMSYWTNKDHFTAGQGLRMRSALASATELQSIRSYQCAKIVGSGKLCSGQSGNYSTSIAAIGTPLTYNWSVSENLQINGSDSNPTVNVSKLSTAASSNSSITLTLNGTTAITRTLSGLRCPSIDIAVGIYDWVRIGHGNMGLIVPIDPEDDLITAYKWEINEDTNSTSNEGSKPYFVGALTCEPYKLNSTSNQAIVNWGSCSKSYLITCYGVYQSGEQFLICSRYVDVGDPINNPCFKNSVHTTIVPNPVSGGTINIVVDKNEQISPCNYKNPSEFQFFNSQLDRINNSITIFDYNGSEVYSNVFDSNQFTIDNLNLISGNNYVVNLYTNEGGFTQQILIVE